MNFYKGKKVLVTGNTGFKGAWLCRILQLYGADVIGYALPPENNSLFKLAGIADEMNCIEGDVRDLKKLEVVFLDLMPEIVFHLAAQPLVRVAYADPVGTYSTNIMGTVNLLECIRKCDSVKSVVNITTDKVYLNKEWEWGYRENEELNGYDPYSNSKSCSELVTSSYIQSFFSDRIIGISTCRAGNVIGGGDFSNNRIIPDCVRAVQEKRTIIVRNPQSVRPYQHVLDPLRAYLMIAAEQYRDCSRAGAYNIGPDECDCLTTGELTELFCKYWGEGACWESREERNAPHEAHLLKLDCSKLKGAFSWRPHWDINKGVEMVCRFHKVMVQGGDIKAELDSEIQEFMKK